MLGFLLVLYLWRNKYWSVNLYKYRSWKDLAKVADILVNERLYCSEYLKLNDPFEGQFLIYRELTIDEDPRNIDEIDTLITDSLSGFMPPRANHLVEILGEKPPRICSLSKSATSINMWSLYADSHEGIAVQIDVSGLDAQAVEYCEKLPEIETECIGIPDGFSPLLTKTHHWRYEEEYRILHDEPFISIKGRILSVIVGCRFPEDDLPILRHLAGDIPISRALLNHHGAHIDLDFL